MTKKEAEFVADLKAVMAKCGDANKSPAARAEHWRLVPEYIQELRARGEHDAADRVARTALEDPQTES